jgi:8-oxo-dGTP pyrophosphatase MutT (NUDIX family)
MKESAGLVIIYDNKILLEHPTGQKWWGTYSIPKGEIEPNENHLEAAIRETEEELGIKIDSTLIDPTTERYIDYTKDGEIYKRVYYFVLYVNEFPENFNLQLEEVNWAGFIGEKEIIKRLYWRFTPILQYLK